MSSIKLKTYQQQILDELELLPSVALFMGTGSGKTYTSLFKVKQNGTTNLLVICPARVVEQWEKNIPHVLPNARIVTFPKRSSASTKNLMIGALSSKDTDVVIVVSLEVVYKLTNLLKVVNNSWTIIVDESHRIKETGTRRSPVKVTNFVLKLGVKTHFKIILTATPTQKEFGGYKDYYSQLKFLGYINMSETEFESRYCRIKDLKFGVQTIRKIVGYKNQEELDSLLSVVAKRYVPKFHEDEPVFVYVDIETTRSYAKLAKEHYYEDLNLMGLSARRVAKKTLTGGRITGNDIHGNSLQYDDNRHKAEWLGEFLDDTDDTAIIFYKYNAELYVLEELLNKKKIPYIVINGANHNKRKSIEEGTYRVVLGQINACGESIDGLQYKTHIAIYYAMPESSVEYVQSLGRIDRVGQTNLPIYYHLVMNKTIDEEICKMLRAKVAFTEEVLDKLNIEMEEDYDD